MHRHLLTSLGYLLFLFCSLNVPAVTAAEKSEEASLKGNYAINLASSLDPFSSTNVAPDPLYKRYRLYKSRFERNGKLWYRLRLGFFPDLGTAQDILNSMETKYPGSWITRVSDKEKQESAGSTIFGKASTAVAEKPQPPPPALAEQAPAVSYDRLAQYMEEARQSMANGESGSAPNTLRT